MEKAVTISDVMQAYAQEAVAYARREFSLDLDYSEDSLRRVDQTLERRCQGGLLTPEVMTEREREELWAICKMLGGYVREVVIRNIGGAWQTKPAADGGATVSLAVTGGVEGSPPEAVWRMLTEPYKGAVTYYRCLKVALGQGEQSVEDGVTHVKLPELSPEPPSGAPPTKRKPRWKFW